MRSYSAIQTGKAKNAASSLDIWAFSEMAYVFYYFYAFQIPFVNGMITKKDMKRAIYFQSIPNGMNDNVVE